MTRYVPIYEPEFMCPSCEFAFRAVWSPGDKIDCPCCNTVWKVEYDLKDDLGVTNVRITEKA